MMNANDVNIKTDKPRTSQFSEARFLLAARGVGESVGCRTLRMGDDSLLPTGGGGLCVAKAACFWGVHLNLGLGRTTAFERDL